jgi:chromosome segregation ATPase
LVVGITLGALFVAALSYLVVDQAQARNGYDHAHDSLTATQRHIGPIAAQLATLTLQLDHLTTQVGSESTAAAQDASQLEGAQAALTAAQTHMAQQASLIGSLKVCLGGVERALNALAVNSQANAAADLKSVSLSCSAAAGADG